MAIQAYRYTGFDKLRRPVAGIIGASSLQEAQRSLREGQIQTTRIWVRQSGFDIRRAFSKMGTARLIVFRSLAALLRAGAGVDASMNIIITQARRMEAEAKLPWTRDSARSFLNNMISLRRDVVENGVPLYTAMERRPNEFTEIESAMVQVGTETGKLPEIFELISLFLERERAIVKQIQDALLYPALVGLAAIGLMGYILIAIIPQFATLYQGFGIQIPSMMVGMLFFSKLLTNPLFDITAVGATGALLYLFFTYIATQEGALRFDQFRMSLPLLGVFTKKIIFVRMCRTMAMLFNAGKTGGDVLAIAGPVMGSPVYTEELRRLQSLVSEGRVDNFASAFQKSQKFDSMFVGYLTIAQDSGQNGEMLEKLASYYEEDVQSLASQIPNLLQVAITLGLGVIVGFVVSAVYIPLTSLSTSIH